MILSDKPFCIKAFASLFTRPVVMALLICIGIVPFLNAQPAAKNWVQYAGGTGPGTGKHIVFISGDEEYGSAEALPVLAKILTTRYGFKCTVLFAIDTKNGTINPMILNNIPGLEQLQTADLMVLFTRFRELPDEQMKYIDEYIKAGKPVIGMRTATHAFNYVANVNSPYAKYSYKSKVKNWEDGFGRQILGETWINHHGSHGNEGTRALVNGILKNQRHPVLKSVSNIWVPSDVYSVRELPAGSQILLYGQPTMGMTAESAVNLAKSIMPVAWVRTYTSETGKTGRVFNTTMGASVDLLNEDLRRLLVNASFWCMGMEQQVPDKANVDYIGEYKPDMFGFDKFKKGLTPDTFSLQN